MGDRSECQVASIESIAFSLQSVKRCASKMVLDAIRSRQWDRLRSRVGHGMGSQFFVQLLVNEQHPEGLLGLTVKSAEKPGRGTA